MRGKFGPPSHAIVVAYAALFIALGGVSYAAITLPANSVGSKQIKRGAVKNSDLGKRAVTSEEVKDGSLLSLDFKSGQLVAGATGPPGPLGAKGDTGTTGPKGDTGTTGPKGDTGAKGDPCLSSDPACKGPQGDKGDPGPGSLVASVVESLATTLANGCTNATSLSIAVPGPGKVLLEANASFGVSHTSGTLDRNMLAIGTTASDCSTLDGAGFSRVPASWPTASNAENVIPVSARRMITVPAAGTFTYYLNNQGDPASSDDLLYRKAMTATYFPD